MQKCWPSEEWRERPSTMCKQTIKFAVAAFNDNGDVNVAVIASRYVFAIENSRLSGPFTTLLRYKMTILKLAANKIRVHTTHSELELGKTASGTQIDCFVQQ